MVDTEGGDSVQMRSRTGADCFWSAMHGRPAGAFLCPRLAHPALLHSASVLNSAPILPPCCPSGDEELRRMCEDGQQDVFELLAARWLKHGDTSQVGG